MKKKEKIIIVILIFIILGIVIYTVVNNENNKKEEEISKEYSITLEDGTKVNTSEKLKETKMFEGLEIKNIELSEKDNLSELTAEITNTTNETLGNYNVNLNFIDEKGNTITTIVGHINEVEAQQTTKLIISTTFAFADAYNFEISK